MGGRVGEKREEVEDLLLSHRLAGRRVERAWDLRGRDYKQNKQKQQVVRVKSMGKAF